LPKIMARIDHGGPRTGRPRPGFMFALKMLQMGTRFCKPAA
jgi:hypothetical protein